jgi:PPOX class probable F420-dependent enzyme
MSRRDVIRMTEEEVRGFLTSSKTIILNSNGPGGFPHPMPMWFMLEDDGTISMTTFTKSQKIKNLRRDPRVSLLVESGTEYAELKGVVIYGQAEIIEDIEVVTDTLVKASGVEDGDAVRTAMAKTAAKRCVLRVAPERVVSWDHSKLGGGY